jgi:hypothetical protein
MKVSQRVWVGTIVTATLFLAIPKLVYPLTQNPEIACQLGVPLPSTAGTYKVHPAKISVKPWRGEHRVLGIFFVPDDYPPGGYGWLTVEGTRLHQPALIASRGRQQNSIKAPSGYYVVKAYIPTRKAIDLILSGKAKQLNQPCNWMLTYQKQG